MELIQQYIKPELLVVAIVLYAIGMAMKNSKSVKDKHIPWILGGVGIILSGIWVFSTQDISGGYQAVLVAIYTTIIQGILCACASVYVNQLIVQAKKPQ